MNRSSIRALLILGICCTQPALASDSDWGCEVLLCMANPNGATALDECKPPIRKLWRHLAEGHSFPTCTFMGGDGGQTTSSSSYARHSWASLSNCAPGYVIRPEEGTPYCSLKGNVSVTIDDQLTRKVWWGKRGVPTDSEQSMVEENFAPGGMKSDLQLEHEAFLARKAEQERQEAATGN